MLGVIATTSDMAFRAALGCVTAVAAYPLWRWASVLMEDRSRAGGWIALALCTAAIVAILLSRFVASESPGARQGLANSSKTR